MAIAIIIHEATRTGAPKIGSLIAHSMSEIEDVYVISLQDGPLVDLCSSLIGQDRVFVCEKDAFSSRASFSARVQLATDVLKSLPIDFVYVNSLASSVFMFAAKILGYPTVLHVHEKMSEMNKLLRAGATKLEAMLAADAVVLAAEKLSGDIVEVFGSIPDKIIDFGIAIDLDQVRENARLSVPPPRNEIGRSLARSHRPIVGMCGLASPRKGSDIFIATAAALPTHDFLWIGGWTPDEAVENTDVFERCREARFTNLYFTGATDNPAAYMQGLDIFFLSSREDPNPLVLAEASALNIPILCFSKSTAVSDLLGRTAISCYGAPNVDDAVRILRAVDSETLRSDAFRNLSGESVLSFDIKQKMPALTALVHEVRSSVHRSAMSLF